MLSKTPHPIRHATARTSLLIETRSLPVAIVEILCRITTKASVPGKHRHYRRADAPRRGSRKNFVWGI